MSRRLSLPAAAVAAWILWLPAVRGSQDEVRTDPGARLPGRLSPELRPAASAERTWASALLASLGDGGGAGISGPLVVVQTHYSDPVDGNVVLLLWEGAQGAVTILVDGESIGTALDPRVPVFVTLLSEGEHTFRVEDAGSPGPGFAETSLSVLLARPFDDPSDLRCAGASPGEDSACDVELRWTNGASPPGYYLVLLDDSAVETTASGAASAITVADVGSGRREWTLIGFLEAVPGSPLALYRGTIVRVACDVECGGPRFVRGSCDGAAATPTISSAIFLLNHLFLGGQEPSCLEACDANADRSSDVSDAVYLLGFLFQGGPAPPDWTAGGPGGGSPQPTCVPGSPVTCAGSQPFCAEP